MMCWSNWRKGDSSETGSLMMYWLNRRTRGICGLNGGRGMGGASRGK
jgi:hypothetical protein